MKTLRKERNWSLYNQKLKQIARIDFFISEEAIQNWTYAGKRNPGGKLLYSDIAIELCLIMKEFYKLAYRQTQGFVDSVFQRMNLDLVIPDYTTISRRASKINVSLRNKNLITNSKEAIVVAVDSTGLSIHTQTQWNRMKHKSDRLLGYERWRKLHVIIDIATGEILDSKYTKSTSNDGPELPGLLSSIDTEISAVCGDMAYDTINCRRAIKERNARQLIPPLRNARISGKNRNISKYKEILEERDEAIKYIQHNKINGDNSLARKAWKEKNGYHARSLVETTMWQIKSHCTDRLRNRREDTRSTQAKIKCKIINLIIAA
jgi:transposase